MLLTSRVDFIPAGKAPQRGADAVKVGYAPSGPLEGAKAQSRYSDGSGG
jgi:hypothetical protein